MSFFRTQFYTALGVNKYSILLLAKSKNSSQADGSLGHVHSVRPKSVEIYINIGKTPQRCLFLKGLENSLFVEKKLSSKRMRCFMKVFERGFGGTTFFKKFSTKLYGITSMSGLMANLAH